MKVAKVKRIEFNPEWLDDSGLFNNCPFPPKGEKWYGEYIITPDSDGFYNLPGGKTQLTNVNRAVSMYAKFQMTNAEILHSTFYNYSGEDTIKESDLVAAVVVIYRFAISIRLGTWNGNSRPSKLNAVKTWSPALRAIGDDPTKGYSKTWITRTGMDTKFTYPRVVIPMCYTSNELYFWSTVTRICDDVLGIENPVHSLETSEQANTYARLSMVPTLAIMANDTLLTLCKSLAMLAHQLDNKTIADPIVVVSTITDLCNAYNTEALRLLTSAVLDLDDLSGAETDVLYMVGTYGPQDDGGLSSKTGAADLMERGYLISDYSCEKNNQLTELGVAAYHRLADKIAKRSN